MGITHGYFDPQGPAVEHATPEVQINGEQTAGDRDVGTGEFAERHTCRFSVMEREQQVHIAVKRDPLVT